MKKIYFIIIVILTTLSSCTEQVRVRTLGGDMEVQVPKGYKVTSATWKESDLFYFVEPMEEGYEPKEKMFIEDSSYDVFESKIIFKESK